MHGLILSGGGALGAYEAGVAQKVFERWAGTVNRVKLVSGTSVGGLNALALTYGGPQFAANIWKEIRAKDIFSGGRLGAVSSMWRLLSGRSLYSTDPLRATINRLMPDWKRIEKSPLQLRIHASDLISKRLIVFDNKSPYLKEGVLASASIPGAFPTQFPVPGVALVDGGVISNTPIRSAIRAGCTRLTIIYLDNEMIRPPGTLEEHLQEQRIVGSRVQVLAPAYVKPKEVLSRSLEVMMTAHLERDLRLLKLINNAVDAGVAHSKHKKLKIDLIQSRKSMVGNTLNFDRDFLDSILRDGSLDATFFYENLA